MTRESDINNKFLRKLLCAYSLFPEAMTVYSSNICQIRIQPRPLCYVSKTVQRGEKKNCLLFSIRNSKNSPRTKMSPMGCCSDKSVMLLVLKNIAEIFPSYTAFCPLSNVNSSYDVPILWSVLSHRGSDKLCLKALLH